MAPHPDAEVLLAALAERGDRKAMARLIALGREAFPAIRRGLTHPSWKVRRDCLRFVDHHPAPELVEAAVARLDDAHPEVRKWAAHALGCDHCKAGERLPVDPLPHLVATARDDPSLRVRRSAVVTLAWNAAPDVGIGRFLAERLDVEKDPKLRHHAEAGLARHREGGPCAAASRA